MVLRTQIISSQWDCLFVSSPDSLKCWGKKSTDGIPALQFLYLKMPTAVQRFTFFRNKGTSASFSLHPRAGVSLC